MIKAQRMWVATACQRLNELGNERKEVVRQILSVK